MTTQSQLRIQFKLDYPQDSLYYSATTPDEITAFGEFLDNGGLAAIQDYVPELQTLALQPPASQNEISSFKGEVYLSDFPLFTVSGEMTDNFDLLIDMMRTLLRRVFFLPPTSPRISALGMFYVQNFAYWDGSGWNVPLSQIAGGGSKM